MFDFNFYSPTKIVFGRQAEKQVGKLLTEFGAKNVLIHYGSERIRKSGLLGKIEQYVSDEGLRFCELGGVVPNPRLSLVRQGIELCRKNSVDFILAIGGGSVIDSAKAIAYGLANEFDVWQLYEHVATAKGAFPVGVVLTIAAAGSETSNSSVITNEQTGQKRGYNSDLCRPKFAVMDPELTLGLPHFQTMAGCTDIMMHTMERYFTQGGNMQITDEIAEGLLRTVKNCTIKLKENPDCYEARAEVMWAGTLSHNGLTGCGANGMDFATHMLEHELSGMFDVTHGAGLAALWGTWARYVCNDCLPRFAKFARNVWGICDQNDETAAQKGIEETEKFFRNIDMPTRISELGIAPTEAQLAEMAHRCALAAGGKKGTAKVLLEEDMLNVYRNAL